MHYLILSKVKKLKCQIEQKFDLSNPYKTPCMALFIDK